MHILLFLLLLALPALAQDHVYLTLPEEDGCHVLMVNFHVPSGQGRAQVDYQATTGGPVLSAQAEPAQIRFGSHQRLVCRVKLSGLRADTSYRFWAHLSTAPRGAAHTLHTPPERALRFVVGGDTTVGTAPAKFLDLASRCDPHLLVLGGDYAYEGGEPNRWGAWDGWLRQLDRLRNRRGELIPVVAALGNHEVLSGSAPSLAGATYFQPFLAAGQSGMQPYFLRRFGKQLALVILDSGLTTPHGGAQSAWLDAALRRSQDCTVRLAAYHIPIYPSVRGFDDRPSAEGRRSWQPLFDKYRLTAAFEHHDHAYKRTHPLRNNQRHPEGTVYLGDGCMGQTPRQPDPGRWYLAAAQPRQHFWLVETSAAGMRARALDLNGATFDDVERKAAR